MTEGWKLLLSLTLSGSLMALGVWGMGRLLKNRLPRAFCYYLWLVVLLRFVCPMGAPESVSHRAVTSPEQIWTVVLREQPPMSPEKAAVPEPEAAESGWKVSPGLALTLVWSGGAVLVLGVQLLSLRKFCRELESAACPVQGWEMELYRSLTPGMDRVPRLLRSCEADSPVLTGVFRPVIYIPAEEMVPQRLGYALSHDLTHLRRADVWYKYAVAVVTAIHWFNPLVWWMARQIQRDCEVSCDQAVSAGLDGNERADYGRTLLWAANRQRLGEERLTAPLGSQKEFLKERILAIMEQRTYSRLTRALMLAVAGAAALSFVVVGAYASGGETTPGESRGTAAGEASSLSEPRQTDEGQSAGQPVLTWPFGERDEISISAMFDGDDKDFPHTGVDFVLEKGTPVLAPAAGTVLEADYGYEDGNYVVLDHGNGLTTRYCHMRDLSCAPGDRLDQGEQVGTVGMTGNSTGYHLHFEVCRDGTAVDPLTLIPDYRGVRE